MEPGTTLAGRYTLLNHLGTGGMATVWSARDEQLRRTVAVKKLNAASPKAGLRFQREARIGAGLRHPNLVTVHDVIADGDDVLLVMEYVEGHSLDVPLRDGSLAHARAMDVLDQTARALDHAHAHEVIHRDVKPANILVAGDGRVLLADLGIATAASVTQITTHDSIMGTPAYMAPERIDGRGATAASDIYALATVAYECFGGRRAHQGRTPLDILAHIVTSETPDLRTAWPEAPPALAEAVGRGMARNPAARPERATQFVDEVRAAFAAA